MRHDVSQRPSRSYFLFPSAARVAGAARPLPIQSARAEWRERRAIGLGDTRAPAAAARLCRPRRGGKTPRARHARPTSRSPGSGVPRGEAVSKLTIQHDDAWHCTFTGQVLQAFDEGPKNRTCGTDSLTAESWQAALHTNEHALQSIIWAFNQRLLHGPPPTTTTCAPTQNPPKKKHETTSTDDPTTRAATTATTTRRSGQQPAKRLHDSHMDTTT